MPKGLIRPQDLAAYRVNRPAPTHSTYEGLDVYGMAAPSSGGVAVGEALNLVGAYEKKTGVSFEDVDDVQFLHRFAETGAGAFADRNRWVGEGAGVQQDQLPDPAFAAERACRFILKNGQPFMAVGSPGGATISTTTLQVIFEHLDRGKSLVGAIEAPRISSRNTTAQAEPRLVDSATGAALKAMGQPMTSVASIGRATATRIEGRNRFTAAAEPTREGGGSAMVVTPQRPALKR